MPGSPSPTGPSDHADHAGRTGFPDEIRRLRARLARSHLLDLATGVLAAQLRLSPAEAAEHLDALADATGLTAEDLAVRHA
ncbi:ANTAR domain-containing protein [Streptomyces sp. MS191]|uniref:ANTAR domain-containing protein n=1 Tax=Streptomyces sp. ms191 TaxID=1827978 RepID=UPI001650876E|nr:ANTAR domain-containing protein [Streptomyces sp. ms191]